MRSVPMQQLDMFGAGPEQPLPAVAPPPEFTLYPDALIKRLNATLRLLYNAEFMPWPAIQADQEINLFLGCVERLPPDRRENLAELFLEQIARVRANRP